MRPLAVGCGAALVLVAACFGLTWLAALAMPDAGADNALLVGSLAIMAGVMGSALAYAGARGGLQGARRRFGRGGPILWLALFAGVLVAGSLLIAAGPGPIAVLLPPLQFLAAILPALAVVSAASWRRGGTTWRGTLVGLAYGGCGATTIALVVEGAVGLLLLVAVVSAPGAESLLAGMEQMMADLQGGSITPNDLNLAPLLTPAVVMAAFALVGLVGPLTEELAKAVGVALAGPRDRGQGWLWGVTVGAGFGIAEALTFGAMAVSLPAWPVNMGIRALTTLMHATMGGLAGMGVYALTAGQRRRGFGLIGLAWIGHAAWNSAVLASTLGGMAAAIGSPVPVWFAAMTALGGLSIIVLFVWVILVFTGMSRAAGETVSPAAAVAGYVVPDSPLPLAPLPAATAASAADRDVTLDQTAAGVAPSLTTDTDVTPDAEGTGPGGTSDKPAAPSPAIVRVADDANLPSPDADETAEDAGPPSLDAREVAVDSDAARTDAGPLDEPPARLTPDDEDGIPGLGVDVTWRPPRPNQD